MKANCLNQTPKLPILKSSQKQRLKLTNLLPKQPKGRAQSRNRKDCQRDLVFLAKNYQETVVKHQSMT